VEFLDWGNDRVKLRLEWSDGIPVLISSIESLGARVTFPHKVLAVELLAAGRGSGHSICNRRLIQTSLGQSLRYVSSRSTQTEKSDTLTVMMSSVEYDFHVEWKLTLPNGCAMLRSEVTVTNDGISPLVLESLTSFNIAFGKSEAGRQTEVADNADALSEWNLFECHNDWLAEGRWVEKNCRDILPSFNPHMVGREPQGAYSIISEGTFSTGTMSPLGFLESREQSLAWGFQVENNGAWRWEIGDGLDDGYLSLAGPNYRDHGWSKVLAIGESFTSVPASVVLGDSMQKVTDELTRYRRLASPLTDEDRFPKVAFNDYMNTLNGDPTTEKLLPLIDAAAGVGAEIFCVDCGWYDDTGDWWPSVGEWKPSKKRFPNGLGEVIDAIKAHGMVAGLWMEPEVVGMKSPVASKLPDSAFFLDHGQRVVEQERYLLDFRNPLVIEHMNAVVDYLIANFGVGYFKFDYNVMPGPGTTFDSDSAGDGLLGHNRAYLKWIKDLQTAYPELVIESCSSGGMRTDFAQSSLFQLLSTSDQQDFRLYPAISTAAPLSMLPEQAGNWAYPEAQMDCEEFNFALMNTMLGHFYLSGYVNHFSAWQKGLTESAVAVYKEKIRPMMSESTPFWPLGLPKWTDRGISLGLRDAGSGQEFIAVWARQTDTDICLSLPQHRGTEIEVRQVFPLDTEILPQWESRWDAAAGQLQLSPLKGIHSARLFEVKRVSGLKADN
jgi:alpha-galactosidase